MMDDASFCNNACNIVMRRYVKGGIEHVYIGPGRQDSAQTAHFIMISIGIAVPSDRVRSKVEAGAAT